MLTSKPPCPNCGEDQLWRLIGPAVRYKCAECGYDTGVLGMVSQPDTAAELLARAVAEARAMRAQRGA